MAVTAHLAPPPSLRTSRRRRHCAPRPTAVTAHLAPPPSLRTSRRRRHCAPRAAAFTVIRYALTR